MLSSGRTGLGWELDRNNEKRRQNHHISSFSFDFRLRDASCAPLWLSVSLLSALPVGLKRACRVRFAFISLLARSLDSFKDHFEAQRTHSQLSPGTFR